MFKITQEKHVTSSWRVLTTECQTQELLVIVFSSCKIITKNAAYTKKRLECEICQTSIIVKQSIIINDKQISTGIWLYNTNKTNRQIWTYFSIKHEEGNKKENDRMINKIKIGD